MAKLSATTRELAASAITMTLQQAGRITEEQAARIVAEKDLQDWNGLETTERDYYLKCARLMLARLAGGANGLPIRDVTIWVLVREDASDLEAVRVPLASSQLRQPL